MTIFVHIECDVHLQSLGNDQKNSRTKTRFSITHLPGLKLSTNLKKMKNLWRNKGYKYFWYSTHSTSMRISVIVYSIWLASYCSFRTLLNDLWPFHSLVFVSTGWRKTRLVSRFAKQVLKHMSACNVCGSPFTWSHDIPSFNWDAFKMSRQQCFFIMINFNCHFTRYIWVGNVGTFVELLIGLAKTNFLFFPLPSNAYAHIDSKVITALL